MGRAAQIGRAAILEAALAIADAEGLDAATMPAVAKRLGVTTMALYRHVENKAALLDGLVEELLTEFPLPPPDLPWTERLTMLTVGIRATALRHPAVFPLLLSRPAFTPVALEVRDYVDRALRDAGVPADEVGRVERLLSTAVLGFAASEAAGRFQQHEQSTIDEDFAHLQRWLLSLLPHDPAEVQPPRI
jgi:AcrR family transcriptional regulator